MMTTFINLIGLILEIIGFSCIGLDLLYHPYTKKHHKPGRLVGYYLGRIGFFLVILGFIFQAISQIIVLTSPITIKQQKEIVLQNQDKPLIKSPTQ
jgi:hypothetical protein